MIAVKEKKEQKPPKRSSKKIPEALIYELLDGEIFYYKGYKEVIKGNKQIEEIMGSSTLQSVLIYHLSSLLFKKLNLDSYYILTNETGVHINHRNNMSNDTAVYEKAVLTPDKINKKYADVPCKLAIEIDIKADLSEAKDYAYVQRKTQKLLDFGVGKVIWIFSETQKVMLALPNENWQIMDWQKDVELWEGQSFNIAQYLQKEGITIDKE